MKQFILWNIVRSITIGFLGPWSSIGTTVQGPSSEQRPNPTSNFVDERLQAFARTYVTLRKLIAEYGPPLRGARNPEHVKKLQREATVKMEQTLDVHGFTPESFQKTLALVTTDDELRNKALELIVQERDKLPVVSPRPRPLRSTRIAFPSSRRRATKQDRRGPPHENGQ